jgi:MinD superfamily P-loop ATPase
LRLAADQATTEEWWEERRHDFELYTSDVVLNEARRGNPTMAAARMEKLRGIPFVARLPVAEELAAQLLAQGTLPPNAADDAAHVGLAAANNMDYLLTWNCAHINNPVLRRRIEDACGYCGLVCPVICTPYELMNWGKS